MSVPPRDMAPSYKRAPRTSEIMHGMELTGTRVLVTGGTSGVGCALVKALVGCGAAVATCGRNTAATAGATETPTRSWTADLSVPGEATRVVQLAAEHLGGLDVVVANAGVQHPAVLTAGPHADLLARAEEEIAVNLRSVVELAVACWPHLAARRSAAFVAVTSGLAYAPKRSAPVYCATKAGVHILLESLRYQAQTDTPGVRVQEVVLPIVDTRMTAGRAGPARKISADAAATAIIHGIERERDVIAVGASRALLALLRLWPPAAKRILRDG